MLYVSRLKFYGFKCYVLSLTCLVSGFMFHTWTPMCFHMFCYIVYLCVLSYIVLCANIVMMFKFYVSYMNSNVFSYVLFYFFIYVSYIVLYITIFMFYVVCFIRNACLFKISYFVVWFMFHNFKFYVLSFTFLSCMCLFYVLCV